MGAGPRTTIHVKLVAVMVVFGCILSPAAAAAGERGLGLDAMYQYGVGLAFGDSSRTDSADVSSIRAPKFPALRLVYELESLTLAVGATTEPSLLAGMRGATRASFYDLGIYADAGDAMEVVVMARWAVLDHRNVGGCLVGVRWGGEPWFLEAAMQMLVISSFEGPGDAAALGGIVSVGAEVWR